MSARAKSGATAPAKAERDPVGEQVIALRSQGKSFVSIAESIGIERSVEAFSMFVAAVGQRPPKERAKLRAEENGRLDGLEQRALRQTDPAERDRKLAAIRKRRRLLAAP